MLATASHYEKRIIDLDNCMIMYSTDILKCIYKINICTLAHGKRIVDLDNCMIMYSIRYSLYQ